MAQPSTPNVGAMEAVVQRTREGVRAQTQALAERFEQGMHVLEQVAQTEIVLREPWLEPMKPCKERMNNWRTTLHTTRGSRR